MCFEHKPQKHVISHTKTYTDRSKIIMLWTSSLSIQSRKRRLREASTIYFTTCMIKLEDAAWCFILSSYLQILKFRLVAIFREPENCFSESVEGFITHVRGQDVVGMRWEIIQPN